MVIDSVVEIAVVQLERPVLVRLRFLVALQNASDVLIYFLHPGLDLGGEVFIERANLGVHSLAAKQAGQSGSET